MSGQQAGSVWRTAEWQPFPVFDEFDSRSLAAVSLRPAPPFSAAVGADRHERLRAMMRREGVDGLIGVAWPEDMDAGDYLTGFPGSWMGATVYLPLEGEPFGFAPPDPAPLAIAVAMLGLEASGAPLWVKDWSFGYEGIPAFVAKLRDRVGSGAVIGGANLAGTALEDYLRAEVPNARFKALDDAYRAVRSIRRGEEATAVRSAAAAVEATAELLTKTISEGVSEAEVTAIVRCNIGRRSFVIGDVPFAPFAGLGSPLVLPTLRGSTMVNNAYDGTWRSRGLQPGIFKQGQLLTTVARCWSGGAEAHLHLSISLGPLNSEAAKVATVVADTLERASGLIKPGARLGDVEEAMTQWLGRPAQPASPYCYLLNPLRQPGDGNLVLEAGMHVHLHPYVTTKAGALGAGCGMLVEPHGADKLNDIPCKVQII